MIDVSDISHNISDSRFSTLLDKLESALVTESDTYGVELDQIMPNDDQTQIFILFNVIDSQSFVGQFKLTTLVKKIAQTIFK